MVQTQPDVKNAGPVADATGPLEPLSSQLKTIIEFLKLRVDDPKGFVEALIEDVLELPREERFTQAGMDAIRERFADEFGSIEAAQVLLPDTNPEKLIQFLSQLTADARSDVLSRIYRIRDADDYVVLATFFHAEQRALQIAEAAAQVEDAERAKEALAVFGGLHMRLTALALNGDTNLGDYDREIVLDTAWAGYYLDQLDDGPSAMPKRPDERSYSELEAECREAGAVILYRDADISLGRGAELLGVSQQRFKEILSAHGVEVRTGPATPEELFSESGFETSE